MACDALEAEAICRARDGIDKSVYYQVVQVDTIKEYSDTLLIFLLKGTMPEKCREGRVVEKEAAHEPPAKVDQGKPFDIRKLDNAEFFEFTRLLEKMEVNSQKGVDQSTAQGSPRTTDTASVM